MNDELQNTVQILKNVPCSDPYGPYARVAEPSVAICVRDWCITELMRHPVDFNAKTRLLAIKIKDIRARWMLTPELQRLGPAP